MKNNNFISLSEAAAMLNITRQAIYASILRKRIPALKIGSILVVDPEDVEKYRDTKFNRNYSVSKDGEKIFDLEKSYYSVRAISKMFGVPSTRVYYLIRNKLIKFHRTGNAYVVEAPDLNEARRLILGKCN